jgi:hypothetical protein
MKIIKEHQDLNTALEAIVWKLFNEIELLTSISGSEEALRDMMNVYIKYHPQFKEHLFYGFGRTHMWVLYSEPGKECYLSYFNT